MKWLTFKVQRTPGFRFNLVDLVFISLLCTLSAWLYLTIAGSTIYLAPLYLGLSFFLFCNVFRIGNHVEPFWYVPFTMLSVYCLYVQDIELFWWQVLLVLEPLKWLLIAWRIIQGPYVGIGSQLMPEPGATDEP